MASVSHKRALSISAQSTPRHASALLSESGKDCSPHFSTRSRPGSHGSMERLRCAKAVEDTTAQRGGRVAAPEPPAAFRQLGGSSWPWAAVSEAVLDQGLLVHVTPRGNEPARSAEPYTARSRWDPSADIVHIRHPWEAREALTRQCHVLLVNHTGHVSICQFSKRREARPVALNNVMMVVCGSEGQKGWSALEERPPSPFLPASATDPFCLQPHSSSPRDPSRPLYKPGPVAFHINQ